MKYIAVLLLALSSHTFAGTSPVQTGGTLPTTCAIGNLFFLTTAAPGFNLYGCTATNTWNAVGQAGANPVTTPTSGPITATLPTPELPQNTVGGCPILPADAIFNVRADGLPVSVSSAAWLTNLAKVVGQVGFGFTSMGAVNIIDNVTAQADTLSNATFNYSTQLNGKPFVLIPPPVRSRETGALATDGNNDHHLITLNHEKCQFYETYQDGGSPLTGLTAASGYTYSGMSYVMPSTANGGGTTDAAGLPLTPLIIHLSEMEAGAIHHAIRFTSCAGCIRNSALWPAISTTAYATGVPPMGSRWILNSSFDISKFSPKAQIVLTALQHYGLILADIGMVNQMTYAADCSLDPTVISAFNEIQQARITQSNFSIVDESGLQISPNSYQAKTTLRTAPAPPIAVGAQIQNFIAQAGQSVTLPTWVNGAGTQSLNWLVNGPGTMSGNVYTAPASVNGPMPVTLVATSAADPTGFTTILGSVIPAGPIRIDIGSLQPLTDPAGNVWMADTLGMLTGAYTFQDDSYPSTNYGGVTLFSSGFYSWGDDAIYGPFVVPNGTYTINFGFAMQGCAGKFLQTTQFDNGLTHGPLMLEANGVDTSFTVAAAEKYTCRMPGIGSISATVTNNLLSVGIRSISSGITQSIPSLNALEILPAGVATDLAVEADRYKTWTQYYLERQEMRRRVTPK